MNQKRWPILIILVVCLVLFSASLFSLVAFEGKPQKPPIELVSLEYEIAEHCPGEVVPFSIEWEVTRPADLRLTPTHNRGLDGQDGTAIAATYMDLRWVTKSQPGTIVDDDLAFTVPQLPPGPYARVLSIGTPSENSRSVFVTLPYTIPDTGCNDSDN